MLLWQKVANESATWCCTSATLDFKTVECRVKHEGMSFLTISLANFGSDFQKSLDQGYVDRSSFTGFRFRAGLPLFLGGFLDRVFDRSSGMLLHEPCIDAILAVRQLTLMFNKISLPCSDARERKAIRGFIQCEQDIRVLDSSLTTSDLADFKRLSRTLFARAFTESDREVYSLEVIPRHGPGSTADSLRGNGKYLQSTWPARLEEILPSGEFLLPNWRYFRQLEAVDILEPGSEIPVKVITVPKTLKTPRIIAVEPTAMQYAQQSILGSLLLSLRKDDFLHKTIGFTDQTPNQRMARVGSLYGSLATLDLSEASDRVSNQLVRTMLSDHPYLHRAVDASRSRKAAVPSPSGGRDTIRLAKFASMGSALCFPFEAMVFLTLVFLGIERELNIPLDRKRIESFSDKVRVYGDDIIIPVEYVHSVITVLETFGSRVNRSKSFWTGKFRESCGRDYFSGHDVSIVRVRQVFPTSRKDVTEVISLVSLRNQLYFAGYWSTCKWLDEEIKRVIKYFPVVLPSSSVIGRHSFLGFETQRTDEYLHCPLVKGWKISSSSPKDSLDGVGALLKCLMMLERKEKSSSLDEFQPTSTTSSSLDCPVNDDRHLERSGRPYAVSIKLGWVPST